MSKHKKPESALGKSLINKKKTKIPKNKEARFEHIEIKKEDHTKLQSIIEQNALTEFLQEAELSSKNFEAAKDIKITTKSEGQTIIIDLNSLKNQGHIKQSQDEILKNMRIPRRPKWDQKTTPELLVQMENQSFLSWRKELSKIEEAHYDLCITPYEKNPEVWRQLWRVIEKSDIVIQIVDGRDPLFFRCTDLEHYVKEVDPMKENILLINKADLLNEAIRKHWNEFFMRHKVNHIFFSAKKEQEKIDKDLAENPDSAIESFENTPNVATRDILLKNLQTLVHKIKGIKTEKAPQNQNANPNLVTLGMVGYPNVGKSSVINVLCKKKLVGVGARPGKTKHFQTIFIEKDLLLCDCPGLVFPSCSSTKAEMACNGVLPIDNLKDYITPVEVIAAKIHKAIFERLYHIKIEIDKPTASQILCAFALQRGYYTGGSGLPDQAKVSRIILKDLVNGKLLLCKLSPEYNEEKDGKIYVCNEFLEKEIEEREEQLKREREIENEKGEEKVEDERKEVDEEFFQKKSENLELNEEDVALLLQGKAVKGIKLTKQMRRDIKHALQRGEHIDIKNLVNPGKKDLKMMGKHAESKYYKNIFAKMEETSKDVKEENDDEFEDIDEEEEDIECKNIFAKMEEKTSKDVKVENDDEFEDIDDNDEEDIE